MQACLMMKKTTRRATNGEDESYMMSALYGEDIEKMRMNIQNATYYLQQVWDNVDDLQIKIKRNDEVLG